MITPSIIDRAAHLPMDIETFATLRGYLLAEAADDAPREITDIDPAIVSGRSFLSLEECDEGLAIVREDRTLLVATAQQPEILHANRTSIAIEEGELVVRYIRRVAEHTGEKSRRYRDAERTVTNHAGRLVRFVSIAEPILAIAEMRRTRAHVQAA